MAKPNAKTETKAETTALAVTEAAPLAVVPQDLQETAGQGTETIGSDDVKPARLTLCQSGSPQRKPGNVKRIEGLQEADMFNDLTGEVYGPGPLKMIVFKCLGSRHIEFHPKPKDGAAGGPQGVKDWNVPADDPRTKFTDGPNGERIKPVATKFYDYLVYLPEQMAILALSMKSTQLAVATRLNGMLKSPLKLDGAVCMNPPAWARTFEISTAMENKHGNDYANYNIRAAGVTDPEARDLCAGLYKAYSMKNIVVDVDDEEREPGSDDGDEM